MTEIQVSIFCYVDNKNEQSYFSDSDAVAGYLLVEGKNQSYTWLELKIFRSAFLYHYQIVKKSLIDSVGHTINRKLFITLLTTYPLKVINYFSEYCYLNSNLLLYSLLFNSNSFLFRYFIVYTHDVLT